MRLLGMLLALTSLPGAGCAVHSQQPHCSLAEQITDDALIGEWLPIKDPDGGKDPLSFAGAGIEFRFRVTPVKGQMYDVAYITADSQSIMPGRLFRMGGHSFLDVREEKGHTLYWVAIHGSQIHLRAPNIRTVFDTLEKNKTLAYVATKQSDGQLESLTLDAPPERLQAFYRPRLYEPGWFTRVGAFEAAGAKVPVAGTGLGGKAQRNLEYWCELRLRWREIIASAAATDYGLSFEEVGYLLALRNIPTDGIDPELTAAAAATTKAVLSCYLAGRELPDNRRMTAIARWVASDKVPPATADPNDPERLGADLRKRLAGLPAGLSKTYGHTFPVF
jgi:hypothetical protein